MKILTPILALLVFGLIGCTTTRTSNYYSYDKPDEQVIIVEKNNANSSQGNGKWVNPLSDEAQINSSQNKNVYTTSEGTSVTVVNNYYNRNPYYQPVVVPWWNDVYYSGFYGYPNGGFNVGFGWGWGSRFNGWY